MLCRRGFWPGWKIPSRNQSRVFVIDGSVARRYARALIDAAAQDGRHEKVGAEIEAVARALSLPEARSMLVNPAFTDVQRRDVVLGLAKKLGLSPLTSNFLSLLVDRQRIAIIEQLARVYRDMVD